MSLFTYIFDLQKQKKLPLWMVNGHVGGCLACWHQWHNISISACSGSPQQCSTFSSNSYYPSLECGLAHWCQATPNTNLKWPPPGRDITSTTWLVQTVIVHSFLPPPTPLSHQAFSFCFCILQVINNCRWRRHGNKATWIINKPHLPACSWLIHLPVHFLERH